MKNNTMMFKTHRVVNEAMSEQPFWVAKPVLGASVSRWEIAQAVASGKGIAVEDVLYVYRRTNEVVTEMLREGCNVNLDLIGFSINLTGKFGSKDATFSASQNSLEVSAYAKPVLRDCLKGITPRNVTNGLKASILSVTDDQAFTLDVVTVPSRVLVAGENLLIDAGRADEGVWLLTKKGEVAATPTVLANTVGTLDLDFGEMPADGEYTLVVKARSGASADFAPAVARKTITVRAA